MSDNEHGSTNDWMDCANIPDEIFEHHIWKHFAYNRWIRVFSLVCKKWKQICEHSTIDPKQIQIHSKSGYDGGKLLKIVKKYQPTILRAKLEYAKDIFLVHRMCEASKRLHTLVLECLNPEEDFDIYIKPIKNITTLALKVKASENFWKNLRVIFPNLKRLQLEQPSNRFPITVDHLTIIDDGYASQRKIDVLDPDVTLHKKDKSIITKLVASDSKSGKRITYEEFFRYFGETELLTALNNFDFEWAKKLLKSGVTMEYEEALYESFYCYQYPSWISIRPFNLKEYWSPIIEHQSHYNRFIQTNLIPVPDAEKFIALCRFKRTKEALIELGKLDETSLASESVTEAFYRKFLPQVTKDELHQNTVIEKVKKICMRSTKFEYISEDDFKKIMDLRDWSASYAVTYNTRIFCTMLSKGCKVLSEDFKRVAQREDADLIIDFIAEQQPSKLFDILIYCSLDKLKNAVNKHGIKLTMEKDGVSLFNKRIQLSVTTVQELIECKHLVNHMDSSGYTPLSAALELTITDIWHIYSKRLLDNGADPTLHRGDKLSPLGLLLARRCPNIYHTINIINLLVEYGADVNAPCLYQERMCSPLMIALLNWVYREIILLLVALDARTDYADETGRTIMDCVNSDDYCKQFIPDLSPI